MQEHALKRRLGFHMSDQEMGAREIVIQDVEGGLERRMEGKSCDRAGEGRGEDAWGRQDGSGVGEELREDRRKVAIFGCWILRVHCDAQSKEKKGVKRRCENVYKGNLETAGIDQLITYY